MIKRNIFDLIGNTDILYLESLSKEYNNNIYVKIEHTNPFGSIKDRVAYKIITDGITSGKINKDTIVIEATSGNTGIGIAGICLKLGLKALIVMPDNASLERIKLIEAYNAKVCLTENYKGMQGAIDKVNELVKDMDNYFICSQFNNKSNTETHYLTTAEEIHKDLPSLFAIVSSIGTGGTISGIGKYYKERGLKTLIVGVEPKESAVINGKTKGTHGIDGIGAGFIPKILNLEVIDEVVEVSTEDAMKSLRELLHKEAFFSGISTAAAFMAVKQLINQINCKNENILFISPDSGIKYLSKMVVKNE